MTGSLKHCPEGIDRELLLEYMENCLDSSARRKLEDHLKRCPFCSSELERMTTMHARLLSYPEAFHPTGEELYRHAILGEDREGQISSHLASCAGCRSEVEILQTLVAEKTSSLSTVKRPLPVYLARELDRIHPLPSSGTRVGISFRTFFSGWLVPRSLRGSVLALGTAAALVLVAVLLVPMWTKFEDVSHLDEFTVPVRGVAPPESTVARPKEEKVQIGAEDKKKDVRVTLPGQGAPTADRNTAKKEVPKPGVFPPALEASPRFSTTPGSATERDGEGPTDELKDSADKNARPEAPASPLVQGDIPRTPNWSGSKRTIQEEDRSRNRKGLSSNAKSRQRMSTPGRAAERAEDKAHSLVKADKQRPAAPPERGGGIVAVQPRIRVMVSIVDTQGREIPALRFTPSQELEKRFTFKGLAESAQVPEEKTAVSATARKDVDSSSPKNAPEKSLRIRVIVSEYEGLYHIKADLMTVGNGGDEQSLEAHDVAKTDVQNRIGSLISSLLQ